MKNKLIKWWDLRKLKRIKFCWLHVYIFNSFKDIHTFKLPLDSTINSPHYEVFNITYTDYNEFGKFTPSMIISRLNGYSGNIDYKIVDDIYKIESPKINHLMRCLIKYPIETKHILSDNIEVFGGLESRNNKRYINIRHGLKNGGYMYSFLLPNEHIKL